MADSDLRARIFGDTDQLARLVQAHPAYQQARATGQPTEIKIGQWTVTIDADGSAHATRGSIVKPLLAAGAIVATGGLLSGVGAAAAGGAASSSSVPTIASTSYGTGLGTMPSVAGGTALGGGAAAGAGASAAIPTIGSTTYGTGMAAASPTIAASSTPAVLSGLNWGTLASKLVPLGLQGFGSFMGSRAANNAAQQQMDAANKALAFSEGIYNDQKANQQPFIGMGHSAVNTLGGLMGLTPAAPVSQPRTAQPTGGPLGGIGQGVLMQAPDGSTRQIPQDQVAMYEARGAKRVS